MSAPRSALILSPHLDDAVFSCGGIIARLADEGWSVTVATAFTVTIQPVTGFALACQLDKNLPSDVDYMGLRREEDRRACHLLGASHLHLDFAEAPHRGYESADALFGPVQEHDAIWRDLACALATLIDATRPELVFAPLGIGGHVDHRQMVHSVRTLGLRPTWYRDTPYVIRAPDATADKLGAPLTSPCLADITPSLARKIAAASAYASQIGFQFGGSDGVARALEDFAWREGELFPAELVFSAEIGGLYPWLSGPPNNRSASRYPPSVPTST